MDPKPLSRGWVCVCIVAAGVGVLAGREGAVRAQREAQAATPATQPATLIESELQVYAYPSTGARDGPTLQGRLDKRVPIHFEGNKLVNVIDYLQDATGLNFFVNWPALQAAGVEPETPVILKLDPTPAETLIKLLLKQVSAGAKESVDAAVIDGIVMVSTQGDVRRMLAEATATDAPATRPAKARPEAALAKPISVDFAGARFDRVVEHFRDATGQNVVVDWRALRAARVFEDTEVSLTLADVPAKRALALALQQVSRSTVDPVEYRLLDGVIMISTRRALDRESTSR